MFTNKTRCPVALLVPVIDHARRAIGAPECAVKITRSKGERITGCAMRVGKMFSVKVSLPVFKHDALACAYRFWEVCLHEFGHIKDYARENLEFAYYRNGASARRIRHDSRPQEIRAERYKEEVKQQIANGTLFGCDNAILDLAIWLEKQQ